MARRHCFEGWARPPSAYMRIVCPTCSAGYEVPDQLLMPGRIVRCARCNGEWAPAPSVLPSEPEPFPPPPPPPPPPPVEPEEPLPPPAPAAETADSPVISEVRRSAMARLAAHPATPRPSSALRLAWAGSIILLVLLIAMAIAWRSEVTTLWPPSARVYSALGLQSAQGPSQ